jgi:hypothetical protein
MAGKEVKRSDTVEQGQLMLLQVSHQEVTQGHV